VIVLVVLKIF